MGIGSTPGIVGVGIGIGSNPGIGSITGIGTGPPDPPG